MSVLEAKAIYELLRDNGELVKMFPLATEDWLQDKRRFVVAYNKNLELLYSDKDVVDEDVLKEDDYYEEL